MRAQWMVGLALVVASHGLGAATVAPGPVLPDPSTVSEAGTAGRAAPAVLPAPEGEPDRLHPPNSWSSLAALRPGRRVAVVTKRQRVLQGRFEGYTAEAIMIVVEGEPVVARRFDVAEVLSLEHSNRVRNTMLSWSAGLAVGLLLGTAGDASTDDELVTDTAATMSTGTGRAVRAMLPRYEVIYRAPAPRP